MSTKKKFGIAAVLLWGLSLVLGFLCMGRFASGSGTNYSSALWVGSREGFVKLSAETGAVLLRVPMREESREFGIDEWNGRVWVLTDRTLYSYGFDGTRVLSLSLQGQRNGCQGGRSRSLVVDTLDGSAFVSRDKKHCPLCSRTERSSRGSGSCTGPRRWLLTPSIPFFSPPPAGGSSPSARPGNTWGRQPLEGTRT